ncbi:MAG: hypothetical protein V4592_08120 [Bacteroidota bacterium]
MTIQEFTANYKLQFNQTVDGDNATFIANAIDRATNTVVASQNVSFSIGKMNQGIRDSQSPISINELTANDVIDYTKRLSTDLLCRRYQVIDYFPLNKDTDIYQLQD